MIEFIVIVIILVIVFNAFLYKGAKNEIMAEKGVESWEEVTGEIEKTNLNELDASIYILYSIANWTPLADLEDFSYFEMKISLPKGFLTEYFDFDLDSDGYVDADKYQDKTKHITDKIIAVDEYDFTTKRSNIIKSAKFLKNKDFQFKRDVVGVCALIINRRPFDTLAQGPPKGELEVFNDMAKILGIKTEYKDVGLIQVEGDFEE